MFGAEAIFPALLILLGCAVLAAAAFGCLILGLILLFGKRRGLGLICLTPSAAYLLVLVYVFAPRPAPHPAPVAVGTIDLRQGTNLKMIFDGGLRPYRLQGLESRCCVFGETSLTVILPHASPFEFKTDRASIDVLAGNEIDSIDLFGENTTVPEAVALTKQICKAWGIPPTGLDDAVAHLGAMPGDSEGWGTEFNQPGIRAWVTFKPLYYNPLFYPLNNVGAFVNAGFILGDHPHGMKFLTQPIQPPPGYESVSMNPPPRVIAFPGQRHRFEVLKWATAGYALLIVLGCPLVLHSASQMSR